MKKILPALILAFYTVIIVGSVVQTPEPTYAEGEMCGDSIQSEPVEQCDTGGESVDCDDDCTLVECQDGNTNETAGEECDDGEETGSCDDDCTAVDCQDGNTNEIAGEECDDGEETMSCDDDCSFVECQDGNTNEIAGEECDDGGETINCDDDCSFVECQDGNTNESNGEECDDGEETMSCDDDCSFVECGDGNTNETSGEECDDVSESASCDDDCSFVECGDGNTNETSGEDCDDGEETGSCDDDCSFVECQDGNTNETAGEDCDDGEETGSCDDDCSFVECQDGNTNETAGEECDDGIETISCDDDCSFVECGDGNTNEADGEECDESGETGSCDDDCTVVECGDGNTNESNGEECDESGEGATCDDDCSAVECGDGNTNEASGEECDDSGESGTCNADCTSLECGDGIINEAGGEECDDDNSADGDGCSSTCVVEENHACTSEPSTCINIFPDLPSDHDTGSSNSDNITNDGSTFTASCTPGESYTFLCPGHIGCSPGAPIETGTFSCPIEGVATFNPVSFPECFLSCGDATDTYIIFRQNSHESEQLTFTYDTTADSPVIQSPLDEAVITDDVTPEIMGTGEVGAAVAVDEGEVELCDTVVDEFGEWRCNANALSEGEHTISVLQTDIAGNTSDTASITITIDTAPETPDLMASDDTGTSDTDNITADASPRFLITGCTNDATVRLSQSVTMSVATGTCVGGEVELELNLGVSMNATFTAAEDTGGGYLNESAGLAVNIDISEPSAPIITTPASAAATTDTTPTISGTGETNATVTVKEGSTTLCTATVSSGTWSCVPGSPLVEGSHTILAFQTDVAGNVSANTSNRTFSVDTTSPTLDEVTPVTTPTTDTTPSYTFSTTEDGTISYGGSCISGTTSATSGEMTISFSTLAAGTYSDCTVTVTDAAGNVSTALSVTTFTVVVEEGGGDDDVEEEDEQSISSSQSGGGSGRSGGGVRGAGDSVPVGVRRGAVVETEAITVQPSSAATTAERRAERLAARAAHAAAPAEPVSWYAQGLEYVRERLGLETRNTQPDEPVRIRTVWSTIDDALATVGRAIPAERKIEQPGRFATRSLTVEILFQAFGLPVDAMLAPTRDATSQVIATARSLGIVNGESDTLRLEQLVNWAEFSTMLVRTLNLFD